MYVSVKENVRLKRRIRGIIQVYKFVWKRFSSDKGKPVERQRRKAKGPVEWQPGYRKGNFFMFQKEQERQFVISRLIEGEISVREAMQKLGLSRRQILRLKAGVLEYGSSYLIHGNKDRTSAHAIDTVTKQKVITIVKERYLGNSYHHICRSLEINHDISLSVSSVSRILRGAGIDGAFKKKQIAAKRYNDRSMIYIGQRREMKYVTIAVDLATKRILSIHVGKPNGEFNFLETVRKAVLYAGVPDEVICEDRSVFVSSYEPDIEDELEGRTYHPTSLGAAMEKIGVEMKTKVDKQTNEEISSLWMDINQHMDFDMWFNNSEYFIERYNKKLPELENYRSIPEGQNLDLLFSLKENLEVNEDSTVYHNGKLFRITLSDGRSAGIRSGKKVTLYTLINRQREIVSYRGAEFHLEEVSGRLRHTI